MLTVPITGVGPFTYPWFLNGITLPDATAASYGLASATAATAGAYTVHFTNSAGATTIAAGTVTIGGGVQSPAHESPHGFCPKRSLAV